MSVTLDKKNLIKSAKQSFIVDATIELIIEHGINNISMDDIAKAANYTKKTLYAYFKSKDAIFLSAYTKDLTERWNYQKEQIQSAKNGLEKLKDWALSLYKFCEMNPQSLQIHNYMDYHFIKRDKVSHAIFEKFESINNDLADGIRDILNQGLVDGSIRENLEIDLTINQFLYTYRSILNRAFSTKYSFSIFDKSTYVDHYLDLFIRGIEKV